MISRLTACAVAFACIATTTIGWAAGSRRAEALTPARAAVNRHVAPEATPIVRLETLVITGRRRDLAN